MKRRLMFVSNSSSSSFIVGYKKEIDLDTFIDDILKMNRDCVLYDLSCKIYSTFINRLKNSDELIIDDYDLDNISKWTQPIIDLFRDGYTVKEPSFIYDQGDYDDEMVINILPNIKTKDFVIRSG